MSLPVNNKVLNEIVEKSNPATGMFVQRVYKETLRELLNIFNSTYYTDGNGKQVKILCIPSNQERPVASQFPGNNIILPSLSVGETSTSNSDERRKYSPMLVHEKYWDEDKQRAVRILSLAPRPINISYKLNIWTKYQEDMDQIKEYVFLLFNPDLEIATQHNYNTKAFLEGESDISEIDVPDSKDRILKKTITFKVETYIPSPKFLYTSTGKIESFNYEFEIDQDKTPTTQETSVNTGILS